jgi:hypothetical protein
LDDIYEATKRLASAENRDGKCGAVKDGRFPTFSVSKDSPPIALDMVKAALDDDL